MATAEPPKETTGKPSMGMVQAQVRIHKQTMVLILQIQMATITSTVIHKTETGATRHRQLCRHNRTEEDSRHWQLLC